MTGDQIISAFKIYYDRVTSFSAPGYLESEILIFLNNAQDEFVENSVFGKNFQPPAIDENQQRGLELSPILFPDEDTPAAEAIFGAKAWSITPIVADRVLYYIDVKAKYTRANPTVTNEYVECQEIKNENASKFIVSDVNQAHFVKPKYFRNDNDLVVLFDSHTTAVTKVGWTIVRRPYPIIAASTEYDASYAAGKMSLDPSVHQKIVDIAVRQALQVVQDPRYNTSVAEQQIKND